MTEPKSGVKTLAIRLSDELHAQLAIVAHLDGITITEAIREAIEGYIQRQRTEGDLATRAAIALEEIERDAEARRAAIQALLHDPVDPVPPRDPKGRSRRRGGEPGVV